MKKIFLVCFLAALILSNYTFADDFNIPLPMGSIPAGAGVSESTWF